MDKECSVQCDFSDRIDNGRNTVSLIKDVITRSINGNFILDKALVYSNTDQ